MPCLLLLLAAVNVLEFVGIGLIELYGWVNYLLGDLSSLSLEEVSP